MWSNVEKNDVQVLKLCQVTQQKPTKGFLGGVPSGAFPSGTSSLVITSGLALVLRAEWGGFSKQGFDVSTKTLANRKAFGWEEVS